MSKNIISTIVARDTSTLLALATLADAATRTVRRVGDTLRFKTELPCISTQDAPHVHEAVWTLVQRGRRVRVFEGRHIYQPRFDADGQRAWSQQDSRLDRTDSGVVVEVQL